jgi:hypothetical protein
METCCIIAVIVIVILVVYSWKDTTETQKKKQKQEEDAEKARKEGAIYHAESIFDSQKKCFDESLSNFMDREFGTYESIYPSLERYVIGMKEANEELKGLSPSADKSAVITKYSNLVKGFKAFGWGVNRLPNTFMMDAARYGEIRSSYWSSVRSMSKTTVDAIVASCDRSLSSKNYSKIFSINLDELLRCIWFYATEKPYSAQSFNQAESVFHRLVESEHIDVVIARLYAMKQMGGENVLRDYVHNLLKQNYSAEDLTLVASALKWMNAYQTENTVLQHMLSTGKQMSPKMQERLHSLANGGGKAPDGFNVTSSGTAMYFDVSALAWKDDEYIGLFENLAFREKTLTYSLAVRDENKELFLTGGISVPGTPAILNKLNAVFAEEYGNVVTATGKKCIALSGSGEERVEGILVQSGECKQLGILVHVARIGKKLNIKFYTLFMPTGARLADQKQQALSLYKKLSPSVAMWESSLKDTALMAIQQLLNTEPQTTFDGGSVSEDRDSDGPIF